MGSSVCPHPWRALCSRPPCLTHATGFPFLEQWLSTGCLCPSGDLWQCLEMFLVVLNLEEGGSIGIS